MCNSIKFNQNAKIQHSTFPFWLRPLFDKSHTCRPPCPIMAGEQKPWGMLHLELNGLEQEALAQCKGVFVVLGYSERALNPMGTMCEN